MTAAVVLDAGWREAVDLPAALPAGSFIQLPDGQVLRVSEDGRLEQLVRGGAPFWRSIASDPAARRAA